MKKYLIILAIILGTTFFLVFSILQNYLAYKFTREASFAKASSLSKTAIILPKIINFLTFKQIDVINFWEFSLKQLPRINELQKDTKSYLEQTISNTEVNKELPKKIINNLEKINTDLNKIDSKQLNEIKSISSDTLLIIKKFLNEDQKYIVMLQNSDEIRATGGFLGSFFILETRNGLINQPQIQDIYAPDGQFQGFVEAPKGLDEYLSSGKGMRLVDANWWPNFPDSAEQIIYFFKQIEKKNYQGIIAINLNTIEELLGVTGDVYLPDYDKTINKNNFAQIARADRNEFFPGSQEKINFLNHFLKIFKLELSKTIQEHPRKILEILPALIASKDLQFYSKDQEITEVLNRRQMNGAMSNNENQLYYFLVESNVGINKANRLVDRQVVIDLTENQEKITINFQNNNPFAYINYQRLYTNKNTIVISVKINGKEIEKIDQRIMSVKDGQEWKEIGFLVPILAKNHGNVEIILDSKLQASEKNKIKIQKQSGIKQINYTINHEGQSQNFELSKDLLLDL